MQRAVSHGNLLRLDKEALVPRAGEISFCKHALKKPPVLNVICTLPTPPQPSTISAGAFCPILLCTVGSGCSVLLREEALRGGAAGDPVGVDSALSTRFKQPAVRSRIRLARIVLYMHRLALLCGWFWEMQAPTTHGSFACPARGAHPTSSANCSGIFSAFAAALLRCPAYSCSGPSQWLCNLSINMSWNETCCSSSVHVW